MWRLWRQQVKRNTAGKRNYSWGKVYFFPAVSHFCQIVFIYIQSCEKGIWNELQSQKRKIKKTEHSGIAEENLKSHTVKTYVNVQSGTEVNNTYLFSRIIHFEDPPPLLPLSPVALATHSIECGYWKSRNTFIHAGFIYPSGVSSSLRLKGNATIIFLDDSIFSKNDSTILWLKQFQIQNWLLFQF